MCLLGISKQIVCLKIWISYQSLKQNDMVISNNSVGIQFLILLLHVLFIITLDSSDVSTSQALQSTAQVLGKHQLYEALWLEPKRNTTWKQENVDIRTVGMLHTDYRIISSLNYKDIKTIMKSIKIPRLPHRYTVCILLAWVPKIMVEIIDLQLKNWEHHKKNVTSDQVHQKILNFIFKIGLCFRITYYPITQKPKTFAFELAYQQGSLTLDLNSQLFFMKLKGEEVKCNSSPFGDEIECSSCTPNCVIGDGNLMHSDVIFNNVLQEEQTEQMSQASMDQEEILGWANREDVVQKVPQNPFLSIIFHVCFGYDKEFISNEFKIHSNIKQITNQIPPLNIIQISNQNTKSTNSTYVDSRDPYILLPDENYQQIITYFSKFLVVEESHSLFLKNQSLKLHDIEFILILMMKNHYRT
ncbi:unnamed protein product [Paramecium octaurelia]|uniref:Uncharacterized protein n=1 Tax=Paramecium octaurelia TaxID=43137 RepID=A0A8S1VLN2_PAROT|nr:unnamed protein product [Paramecium octaurelia]